MTEMLKDEIIDKSVTPTKFKHVTKALLDNALSGPPSREGIDEIVRGMFSSLVLPRSLCCLY
jgi:hypothetical protein